MSKGSLSLALVLFLAAVSAAGAQTPRTVTVTGNARLEFPPDSATLTAGVLLRGESPEGLQRALQEATAKVLGFLSGVGIDAADVSSAGVSIEETDRDYDDPDCRRLPDGMAYEGCTSVRIVLRQMEAYDALVRGLFANGATRIDAVEFESSRAEEWARKARARAAADAAERAMDIADGLGQRIGRPLEVSDGTRGGRFPRRLGKKPAVLVDGVSGPGLEEGLVSGPGPTTLRANRLSVSASVSVVFELLDAVPTAEPIGPPGSSSRNRKSTSQSGWIAEPSQPGASSRHRGSTGQPGGIAEPSPPGASPSQPSQVVSARRSGRVR